MRNIAGYLFFLLFFGGLTRMLCVTVPCLTGKRFYITIRNTRLAHMLVASSVGTRPKISQAARHRLSVWGLLGYLALAASSVRFFSLVSLAGLRDTAVLPRLWRSCSPVFLLILLFCAADTLLGTFAGRKKRPARTLKSARLDAAPLELRAEAARIFSAPDRIVFDPENGEYYYISGKDLLRLGSDGAFLSLTPEADCPRVLRAMRTGTVVTGR